MTDLENEALKSVKQNKNLSKDYLLSVINEFINGQVTHNYDQYQLAFYKMRFIRNYEGLV